MADSAGIHVLVRYVEYSSGKKIEVKTTGHQAFGTPFTDIADESIIRKIPVTRTTTKDEKWVFLFWTINDSKGSTFEQDLEFKHIMTSPTVASAWYTRVGPPGPKCLKYTPLAFSGALNKFLPDTPIHSVSPPSLLSKDKRTVSNKTSAKIIAKASIKTSAGTEDFDYWYVHGALPTVTIAGAKGSESERITTVAKGTCPRLIAVYNPPPPLPDPLPYIAFLRHFVRYVDKHYDPGLIIPRHFPDPPPIRERSGLGASESYRSDLKNTIDYLGEVKEMLTKELRSDKRPRRR
jgi:hypothetical protein